MKTIHQTMVTPLPVSIRNRSGFTIVELLIVIIVIAILAAISIATYNGIQDRARMTKTIATVTNYEKILELYYANNGTYPQGDQGYGSVCLGTVADYPEKDGFGEGECISVSDDDWRDPRSIDPGLNQALIDGGTSIPSTSDTVEVASDDKRFRGVAYSTQDYWHWDGSTSTNLGMRAAIYYWLKGEHDTCPKGERSGWYDDMTECRVNLDPFTADYSMGSGGEL